MPYGAIQYEENLIENSLHLHSEINIKTDFIIFVHLDIIILFQMGILCMNYMKLNLYGGVRWWLLC